MSHTSRARLEMCRATNNNIADQLQQASQLMETAAFQSAGRLESAATAQIILLAAQAQKLADRLEARGF
ncbi:hypothetical protein ACS3SW_19825 [Roseobacteraceae bacterium S113]